MWSKELDLVKTRVWGVYQDTPGSKTFSLQLKIQGYTGSKEDGYPLVPLPDDIAAAKASGDNSLWELGGYVSVSVEEEDTQNIEEALKVLLEWTKQSSEQKKNGLKPDYKEMPKLWFEPENEQAGIQLLPKIREGKLSFSGWAHRGLEWHGDSIRRGRKVELDEYFLNGKQNPNGRPNQVKPITRKSLVTPEVPNIPDVSEIPY